MYRIRILLAMLVGAFLLNPMIVKSKKSEYTLVSLEGQFQYLMAQHHNFIRKQNKIFSEFEKMFFSDFKFVTEKTVSDFFRQIKTANLKEKEDDIYRSITVTHMNMIISNGKYHTVNYIYQSDGRNIRFTKYTDDNGSILKAVYEFSPNGKLLKAKEYKNRSLMQKKLYQI